MAVLVSITTLILVGIALASQRPPRISGPPPEVVGAPQVALPDDLVAGHSYSQALGPVQDGLSEVAYYVYTYNHRNLAPLHLVLEDAGQVVRRSVVAVKPSNDLATFAFPPLADSSRRQLVARLTADGADQESALSLFVVDQPAAGVPHLMHDNVDTGRFAPLRLRYGAPTALKDQMLAISDRASQYRPDPFKTPLPVLTAALALALSAALLGALLGLGPGPLGCRR